MSDARDTPRIERSFRLVFGLGGRIASPVADWMGVGRAAEDLMVAAIGRVLSGPELERIVAAVLESPGMTRLVDQVLESPGIARLGDQVLESQAAERLVARVIESRLMDGAVARLLASDDLWLIVDEVARSPAVTDAIGHQSIGFAGEIAGVVRDRSRGADSRLEQLARRLVHGHIKANGDK